MRQFIIRGTTPCIAFRFRHVPVSDMTAAYLTIKQGSDTITRDITTAQTDGNKLIWTLTQSETLSLSDGEIIRLQCRYKLKDGWAGASAVYETEGRMILKDGVI